MSLFKSVLTGIGISLLSVVIFCAALGTVMLFFTVSDSMLSAVSLAVIGISAYVGGYFSTQKFRSMGLIQGVLCGAGLFLAIFLLSAAFDLFSFEDMTLIKAAVSAVCGVVGGVKGVNTKKTRERH